MMAVVRTRVLVVDDETSLRRSLRRVLKNAGYEVEEAADGLEALERLRGGAFDLVLTDLRMPRADGLDLLRGIRKASVSLPVVVLTAQGTVRDCVEAMRLGAFDFVAKPFDNAELRAVLRAALAASDERPPLGASSSEEAPVATGTPRTALIGSSPQIAQVIDTVERVANTDVTVLLTGESGSGKEVVAKLIHASSSRAGGRFVPVNCGAIPSGLVESELFGHERGAFTGATERRKGRFVEADGGTLFLDEIAELSLGAQVHLLRVLQDHEVQPVGGGSHTVDVRVIAATNRDLADMVKDGTFRRDLYYRLNVMPLVVPPLRARGRDVVLLAEHRLGEMCRLLGRKVRLTDQALDVLQRHDWPGNVRELANVVERLVILDADGLITGDDVTRCLYPPAVAELLPVAPEAMPDESLALPATLLQVERTLVEEAMRRTEGNKRRAAELLGINRTTLIEKLRRFARAGGRS